MRLPAMEIKDIYDLFQELRKRGTSLSARSLLRTNVTECTNVCIVLMDGRMDGWMNAWLDGSTVRC